MERKNKQQRVRSLNIASLQTAMLYCHVRLASQHSALIVKGTVQCAQKLCIDGANLPSHILNKLSYTIAIANFPMTSIIILQLNRIKHVKNVFPSCFAVKYSAFNFIEMYMECTIVYGDHKCNLILATKHLL